MLTAITGTIGSGKSTVTQILRELGKNVVSCDEINARLLCERDYAERLAEEFPEAVKNGAVDKKALAAIIFNDENARKKLNSMSHPIIYGRVKAMAEEMSGDVFVEVPLLAESKMAYSFDRIWVVESREEEQLDRVVKRDNITYETARRILDVQKKNRITNMSFTVIENSGDFDALKRKVMTLL